MEVRDLWPAIFRDLGVLRNETALRLLERWEMSLYRSATRVVTVTDSFRDNIIGRGIPAEKVVTITNGADTDFWQPGKAAPQELRSRLGLTGKFVVLYIGAHGISHALSAQLRAAARLKSESNIHFVFVGEGAEKERLQNEARALGLGSVLFRDPVGREEVRDYYAMADLCLVPLRAIPLFDTFIPSKMFEIMSMERPLLASLRGEAARILTRSGAARIVAPEDDEAVAAAIGDLRNKPAELVGMGIAGRRFVESCYSRRMLARRYLELMAEACTGGQADRQAQ
jgi:glycosyltransferase involved in cell wall biosynthesis